MANRRPLVNSSGDVSEIITSDSLAVGGITLATTGGPTTNVGIFTWDDGNGTATLGLKGGNVTVPLGQKQVITVYNGTGSTLSVGQVVYITGSQGNRLSVQLASAASEASSSVTIGLVAETILNGAEGFVTTNGILEHIDTSALTAGSALWLSSTPGLYSQTKPTAPNHGVLVGYVVRSDNTVGSIFVHIQNGYELDELHNVTITSVADKDNLQYDSATSTWKNYNRINTLNNLRIFIQSTAPSSPQVDDIWFDTSGI